MDNELREDIFRLYANFCSGLADATRLLMLYALSENPRNVTELAEQLDISQPTASRHLRVLRERGMVVAHREGQSVCYELADQRIIEALNLLRGVMADQFTSRSELAQHVTDNSTS